MSYINIWEMSSSAAILIVAIVVIRALAIHKLPKVAFMALWSLAVVRLLIPFEIPSSFSVYSLINHFVKADVTTKSQSAFAPHMPSAIGAVQHTAADFVPQATDQIPLLTIVWVVGTVACLVFFAIAYIKCRREFACSLPVQHSYVSDWIASHRLARKIQVRQSDKVKAPLTYGVLRPVILLPKDTDWDNHQQLNYVLTHELVHIHRFDALYKLLLALCVCVHWFNPLVWIAYILCNRDIELSCDEQVVRRFGETTKSFYALTLINMEERKSKLTPLCNNFSKNAIEERITSIMKLKKASIIGITAAVALVAGTATVFATSAKTAEVEPKLIATADRLANDNAKIDINNFTLSVTDEDNGATKYSEDGGNTWVDEGVYLIANPTPDVTWWTYDECKAWMEQELENLQSLLGDTGTGYYDKDGNLHKITQQDIDNFTKQHRGILESIKNGVKISKTVNGNDNIMLSANPDDVMETQTAFTMAVVGDDSDPVVFGPYGTKEELVAELVLYCEEQVEAGAMTQDEADKILGK